MRGYILTYYRLRENICQLWVLKTGGDLNFYVCSTSLWVYATAERKKKKKKKERKKTGNCEY